MFFKVKNLPLVSQVIEEATKAGANQIQGTRFTIDDPNKFREEARNKAIQNAKDQAQRLSKLLGVQLGNVVSFAESNGDSNIMYDRALNAEQSALGAGGSPQLEPGTQTIHSVVTLWFERK